MSKYRLKLFVTGRTPPSERALVNLQEICERQFPGQYELEVIDIIEQPQAADDDRIIATPTLIRVLPPPLRRVIGDLSDREKVLLGLDLRHIDEEHT
jgi:circadian clock protein KaiB